MSYSSQNYGAGDPDCPICKGLGYVSYHVPEGHPQFGKVFDCQCRASKVEGERRSYLRRLGGLEALGDKTFDNFNAEGVGLQDKERAGLRRVYDRCVSYASAPQGWLIMTGGYGCGKTHLAAAIANAYIGGEHRALFITAPDLLDHLRASIRGDDSDDTDQTQRFEQVRSVPLLILDDLGTESPTAWAVEKLYQVLNYRYNAHLPTIITTNRDLDDIEMRLRSRLFDPDLCEVLHITAPDYRQSGMTLNQSSLNSLSLYSAMTFDTFKVRRDLNKEQREVLQFALTAAKEFAENPQGWLVLMGEYGCGKTHLAAAIANAQVKAGSSVLFVTVADLLDHLRAAFAPNSTVSYDKRFNETRSAPLLILDDLNTESATPWVREKLQQLINYRYVAKLPTVFTTAQTLESLDPRLVTRMRDKRISSLVLIHAPAFLGER